MEKFKETHKWKKDEITKRASPTVGQRELGKESREKLGKKKPLTEHR